MIYFIYRNGFAESVRKQQKDRYRRASQKLERKFKHSAEGKPVSVAFILQKRPSAKEIEKS